METCLPLALFSPWKFRRHCRLIHYVRINLWNFSPCSSAGCQCPVFLARLPPGSRPADLELSSLPPCQAFSVSPSPRPALPLPVCALALASIPLAMARSIACEAFLLQPCHVSLFPSRTSLNECSLLRLCLGLPLTHCTWSVLFTSSNYWPKVFHRILFYLYNTCCLHSNVQLFCLKHWVLHSFFCCSVSPSICLVMVIPKDWLRSFIGTLL